MLSWYFWTGFVSALLVVGILIGLLVRAALRYAKPAGPSMFVVICNDDPTLMLGVPTRELGVPTRELAISVVRQFREGGLKTQIVLYRPAAEVDAVQGDEL
jgi:hypothetical protein